MVSVKRIYMHIKGRDREREEEVLYDVIYNVLGDYSNRLRRV